MEMAPLTERSKGKGWNGPTQLTHYIESGGHHAAIHHDDNHLSNKTPSFSVVRWRFEPTSVLGKSQEASQATPKEETESDIAATFLAASPSFPPISPITKCSHRNLISRSDDITSSSSSLFPMGATDGRKDGRSAVGVGFACTPLYFHGLNREVVKVEVLFCIYFSQWLSPSNYI